MTSRTLRRHLAFRTMAGNATGNSRHDYIARQTALRGVMTIVTLYHPVSSVIKITSHHPAIDKNGLRDITRGIWPRLRVVAERTAIE